MSAFKSFTVCQQREKKSSCENYPFFLSVWAPSFEIPNFVCFVFICTCAHFLFFQRRLKKQIYGPKSTVVSLKVLVLWFQHTDNKKTQERGFCREGRKNVDYLNLKKMYVFSSFISLFSHYLLYLWQLNLLFSVLRRNEKIGFCHHFNNMWCNLQNPRISRHGLSTSAQIALQT